MTHFILDEIVITLCTARNAYSDLICEWVINKTV